MNGCDRFVRGWSHARGRSALLGVGMLCGGLVVFAGCSETITEGQKGPLPDVVLSFDPVDGTTAWSGSAVTLRLTDNAGIADPALIANIQAHVVLRTWPEGADAAFTTQQDQSVDATTKVLRVTPQGSLDDRWYIVALTSVTRPLRPLAPLEDGSAGTRFRRGSHPRVAGIRFCRIDAANTKMLIDFSEPVTFTRNADDLVSMAVGGASSACGQYDFTGTTAMFACGLPQAATSAIVAVGAGVVGATDVAMDPGSWTVDVAGLAPGGCTQHRPAP